MTVVIDGTEYLPASVVAQQLETTETKILMLLKQKALGGEFIEGSWFVTTSSLACYDAHARDPEQQASCKTSCSSSGCSCH
jgi:hypothetical protein